MNGWSFAEIKRQIEYKAAWEGVLVVTLSRFATRGTSVTCFQCGERLQESRQLKRKVWCEKCRTMFDRDEVAAVNIARRGRLRFDRSKGEAVEAMVQESDAPMETGKVILKVDASKLASWHEPTS
jgi:transposase